MLICLRNGRDCRGEGINNTTRNKIESTHSTPTTPSKTTCLAENDGILGFKTGWISNKQEGYLLSGWNGLGIVCTETVFRIFSRQIIGFHTREFVKKGFYGFQNDTGEDVKRASMKHTDSDTPDTMVYGAVNESLHARNKRIASL